MKYLTQEQNDTLFNYLSLVYTVVMHLLRSCLISWANTQKHTHTRS